MGRLAAAVLCFAATLAAQSEAEKIVATASDGHETFAFVRRPEGAGKFPAVLFVHGGTGTQTEEQCREQALRGAAQNWFLARGYVTVTGTHRAREIDPQAPADLDWTALVEAAKRLPYVDPASVVMLGGSGGGSIVLEVAGRTDLAAVAAGEPATVLFTGMMRRDPSHAPGRRYTGQDRETAAMMADPRSFYTLELQAFTREKIARIAAPVLIASGEVHPVNRVNAEIVIPEMRAASKDLTVYLYPGQPHGFYFGRTPTPAIAEKFYRDCDAFFRRHLNTQPAGEP